MATTGQNAPAWPLRPPAAGVVLPGGLSSDHLRASWTSARAQRAVGLELDVGDFDAIRRAWVTDCPADRPRLALRTRCKTTRKSEAERVLRDELLRAARVGAEVLNLRLPGLADTGASESSFFRYGETMNFAYRLLRETRLDAEAAGVGMAIEVAVDDWLASPVEACDLLDAVCSSAVGVCLDATRLHRPTAIFDWISTLARRVRFVRSASVAGGDVEQTAIARIGVELFAALGDAGYEGFVCLIESDHEVSGKLACS